MHSFIQFILVHMFNFHKKLGTKQQVKQDKYVYEDKKRWRLKQ